MMGGDSAGLMERSGDTVMVEATAVKAHQSESVVVVGARPNSNNSNNNNSGDDDEDKGAAAAAAAANGGDEGDKGNCGGNRWPRQETLALLKIRLDMDGVFRDSTLKGPLWEEVARKLNQVGYKRSAKKCKEKFENVYKYHKRTKEGRSGKPEGKTYKFFDELQALENQCNFSKSNTESSKVSHVTVISPPLPAVMSVPTNPTIGMTTMNSRIPTAAQTPYPTPNVFAAASTSSATASDEGLEERYRRKRKWKDYFRRLMRKLLVKQEEMQKRFLEAIDERDQERMAREEAWRMQEMGRINREHEILVQERSTAAAKDAAVIAFLQKLSGQCNSPNPLIQSPTLPPQPQTVPEAPVIQQQQQQIQLQPQREAVVSAAAATAAPPPPAAAAAISKMENSDGGGGGSSRWPKAEVNALITLRTNLDCKYQENALKGPLWEEISEGMRRLGYNRNAKRCKEKWENINKYFKKVKESNRKRPDDSKTCPYFHQLEAIYKEKSTKTSSENSIGVSFHDVSKQMEPLMVQPEQQWRPPTQLDQQHVQHVQQAFMEGFRDQVNEEDDEGDEDDDHDDDDTMEDDQESERSHKIGTNNLNEQMIS